MDGKTLVNVKKCFIINERTGQQYDIADTADEINVEPIISDGKRDILRVKNKILGINETEDIVIGYKLTLTDNVFNLNVMQLIDGGTITGNHYQSIPAGQVVEKDPFTLEVYTEEKDYSRTVGFTKFVWKHCKGKVPKFNVKDGEFIVPKFEAESIPYKGEIALDIESLLELPTIPGTTASFTVVGGTVTDNNVDVSVSITTNVKWTFIAPINPDDVTSTNFKVTKISDGGIVSGTLTIDDTKTIVTFVPYGIEANTQYQAQANAVNLLDGTGTTTSINVSFTTM